MWQAANRAPSTSHLSEVGMPLRIPECPRGPGAVGARAEGKKQVQLERSRLWNWRHGFRLRMWAKKQKEEELRAKAQEAAEQEKTPKLDAGDKAQGKSGGKKTNARINRQASCQGHICKLIRLGKERQGLPAYVGSLADSLSSYVLPEEILPSACTSNLRSKNT
eukprot:1141321-Pelagomonas_calceolata.AAC.7